MVAGMNAETIINYLIPVALSAMMFAMGVGLRPADFARVRRSPIALALGILGQLVLLPALGVLVASQSGLPMEMQVGLVLVAACPGGPSSNLYTYHARGDLALSVALTAVSGIVTVFTIPLWVNFAGRLFAEELPPVFMPVIPTMARVAAVTVVPVALGMLMRSRLDDGQAVKWEKRMTRIATGILVVLVVGAVQKEASNLVRYATEAGAAVLALGAGAMAVGWTLGWAACQGPRMAITLAIEVGMQNSGLAIALALTSFTASRTATGDVPFAVPAAVYALLMYVLCAVAIWVGRRTVKLDLPDAGR
jgi:BASS family bile acid:Na+ symporter